MANEIRKRDKEGERLELSEGGQWIPFPEDVPSEQVIRETISRWAPLMRIADWKIDFRFASAREIRESCEGKSGNVAYCARQRLLKQAVIEIDPEHPDTKEDWQRVLAHEMFHIVTDDYQYHADCCLDFVPDQAHETLGNQMNMYYERMVEDLAAGFIAALREGR